MNVNTKEINTKQRQKIVLAALLHDIGKFWERADVKWDQSAIIKKSFPNNEFNHTVPTYDNNGPMYGHALWTQAFFDKFDIGEHLNLDSYADNNLATLSSRHHKPTNHIEGIISLADKWSSSIDRPDEGEEGVIGYKKVRDKWGENFNKKVPLGSIFDQIETDKISEKKPNAFSLKKLNVLDDSTIYPTELKEDKNKYLTDQYASLWAEFEKEILALENRCKTFESYYISLCDILRNYTWCIPSATNVEPCNVSLYEHLKTTAGIALCIYDYFEFHNKEVNYSGTQDAQVKNEDCLLMLCIDIAGIQKFIYDIANKKAAKSLKGRSFYLQLLMNYIIEQILNHQDIQAYHTNVIYASGGKAYLLLPNLDRVKKAINEVDEQIQTYLWEEHKAKIYAVFGYIGFSYETFKNNAKNEWTNTISSKDITTKERKNIVKDDPLDLGHIWRLVSDRAAAKKNKKFLAKVTDFNTLFEPISYEDETKVCAVTGERSHKLVDLNDGRDKDNQIMVLQSVYNQTKLGDSLKNGDYLISYRNSVGLEGDIKILDTLYEIKSTGMPQKLPSSKYEFATVNSLNKTDLYTTLNDTAFRTIFYGGNNQPIKDGENKTFEDLALSEDGDNTKLAILRMDVDNLGQIFINGFDEKVQKKSFAAYSTLSFLLEAFFCGHINHIQQSDPFINYVQILYSGGDDLFAVGRWDAILEFAAKIRAEFRRFVGRDDITISGGIAIVGSKYPIMKSADLAGEMEKEAKAFNNKSKNAINFFGETVSWGKEFDLVSGIKDSFVFFDGTISRALIQNVQKYKLIKDDGIKRKNRDMSYVWNSAYSITRTLERVKDDNAFSFVDNIRKNIIHNEEYGSERYLDLIALGARWAEYILKLKKQ